MDRNFDRLDSSDGIALLREPTDPDSPAPSIAPFELAEARPLSQNLGRALTEMTWIGDGANPDVVLRHATNDELEVWINRLGHPPAYVLACWDVDHQFFFEVPKEVASDVLAQALNDVWWAITTLDEDLLEELQAVL